MKIPLSIKHSLRKLYTAFCIITARVIHYWHSRRNHPISSRQPLIFVLLISRPQDIDLFIDIYHQSLKHPEIEVFFWATKRALTHFPTTKKLLDEKGIQTAFTVTHGNLIAAIFKLLKIDALLNTVESTVASHKVPYIITLIANACKVHTYTMQHGFENVGLTYQDPELGSNVHFAAQNVLTWGPVEQLPGVVAMDTRRKCLAVGCPKVHLANLGKSQHQVSETPFIAVFEGLHVDRFDDRYMQLFFADLQHMADTFANLHFILKPHPGIIQRSKTHTEFLHSMSNIEVLDPARTDITHWPTPTLLANSLAVVTTPSTIALDAAMAAAPVAVIRYGQNIPYYAYYEPLPLIDTTRNWHDFLATALTKRSQLEKSSQSFLKRVSLPGNAAEHILAVVSGKKH
ncbi:MAG: hypothetical protein U9P07_04380 [Pseudomonadota bacterium]|nr:hypothetical protein [Pseudomonadota bacterium]